MSAVEERLDEAVDTLKRVPAPDIQRHITRWPEFIRGHAGLGVHRRCGRGLRTDRSAPRRADALMPDVAVPWQVIALVGTPALGALFGLVLHTRRQAADQRVALADYRTHVAERYVPVAVQDAFEKEVMRRLERIEDKLDAQAEAFAAALAGGD